MPIAMPYLPPPVTLRTPALPSNLCFCRAAKTFPLSDTPAQLLLTRVYRCTFHGKGSGDGCPCTAKLSAWVLQPPLSTTTDAAGNVTVRRAVSYLLDCDTEHSHGHVCSGLGAGLAAVRRVGRMRVAPGVVRNISKRFVPPSVLNTFVETVSECPWCKGCKGWHALCCTAKCALLGLSRMLCLWNVCAGVHSWNSGVAAPMR